MRNVRVLIFDEDIENGVYSSFNHPIVLSPNITVLTFGHNFNHPISLTKNIKYMSLQDIILINPLF